MSCADNVQYHLNYQRAITTTEETWEQNIKSSLRSFPHFVYARNNWNLRQVPINQLSTLSDIRSPNAGTAFQLKTKRNEGMFL